MDASLNNKLFNLSDELALLIYPLTYKFPSEEKYALADQIRRSIVSVPANIMEGVARGGQKEIRQFFNIAYASLKEAKYLIYFAYKQGFISKNNYQIIWEKSEQLSKLLFTFLKILKKS